MSVRFLSGVNVDQNTLFVDDVNNRVGIGTASPSGSLHVYKSAGQANVIVDAGNNIAYFFANNGANWGLWGFQAQPFTLATNGSERFRITSDGNVGIGTTAPAEQLHVVGDTRTTRFILTDTGNVGRLTMEIDSSDNTVLTTGTTTGTRSLLFLTETVERMRINSVGDVGIGTNAPTATGNYRTLEVKSANASAGGMFILATSDNAGVMRMYSTSTVLYIDDSSSTSDLYFKTNGANYVALGTNNAERVRVTSAGTVGINTTTSTDRLTVAGGSVFSANLTTLGENYSLASSARGSIYEVAGTVVRIVSLNNAVNSAALINFNAYNSDNGATGAFIGAAAGPTGNGPANLVFGRRTGTTAWGETMRITDAGTAYFANEIYLRDGETTSGDILVRIYDSSDDGVIDVYQNNSVTARINGNGASYFNGGNVGIGVTAPAFKLQVGTPAVLAGSDYAWSFDLTRANDTVRGFSIGQADGGGTVVLGSHDADMAFGHTFGVDANGLPAFYETMRIQHVDQAVGNVGIGTDNPTTKLYVDNGESTFNRGNSDGAIARFRGKNAEKAVIGTVESWFSGEVGIGTTSPVTGLDVRTSTYSNTTARFGATRPVYIVNNDPIIGFNQYYDNAWKAGTTGYSGNIGMNNSGEMYFNVSTASVATDGTVTQRQAMKIFNDANITWGTGGVAAWGEGLLTMNSGWGTGLYPTLGSYDGSTGSLVMLHNPHVPFRTDNAASGSYTGRAGLRMAIDTDATGWWDAGLAGDFYHIFKSTGGEFLRITNTGNVGIGTTNPDTKLQIAATGSVGLSVRSNTSGDAYMRLYSDATIEADWFIDRSESTINFRTVQSKPLVFATNNSEAMRITAAGLVGIGTTDVEETLTVAKVGGGDGTVAGFRSDATFSQFEVETKDAQVSWGLNAVGNRNIYFKTNSDERLRITGAGNVGIGTTSPSALLHVATASTTGTTSMLSLSRASGYGQTLFEQTYDSTYFTAGKTLTLKNDAGTAFIHFAGNNAGTQTNVLIPTGNVGIGTTSPSEKLSVVGNVSVTSGEYRLYNNSTVLSATSGSLLSINAGGFSNVSVVNGNFGIGTTAPNAYLEVNSPSSVIYDATDDAGQAGGSTASILVKNYNQTDQTFGQIVFWNKGSGRGISRIVSISTASASTALAFVTENNNTKAEKMRITAAGNVGIGTTAPSTRLEVASSQSNSSIRTGGLEMQSYDVNNSWYAENLYFDGGSWRLRNTGFATQMYMQSGSIDFNRVATGAGGSAATLLTTMRLAANGNVLIGTTTDNGYKLQVSGSASFITGNQSLTIFQVNGWATNYLLSDLSASAVAHIFGKGNSLNNSATLRYYHAADASSSNYIGLGFYGNDDLLRVFVDAGVRLTGYGSGTKTGTVAYNLGVTSTGNIIELPGGVVDGSGTANQLARWQDANTLTNAGIEDNGSSIAIGRDAFYSSTNYGIAYSAVTGTSGGTAWFDTVTTSSARLYNITIFANPNSSGSGSYKDFYYGKIIVGNGYNGSAVVDFINYHQESPQPRSLYGSGGGNLTVTAVFVYGGSEVTEVPSGATYTIRIKIAGYVIPGAGTQINLQRIM